MNEANLYARQIAYLRCPRKVRGHTLAAYGTAPTLAACQAIVDAHTLPERKFRAMCERRQYLA